MSETDDATPSRDIDHEKIREAYQTLVDAKHSHKEPIFDHEQVDESLLLMQQALPEFPHGET